MNTITWKPGENSELDKLFDDLREKQYQDKTHRLWKNYSREFLQYTVALTICFDDNNIPEMCSSIASRNCWPNGAYRILNRLWKANNKIAFPRRMSPSFGHSAISQITWLRENTECELYFISRQTPHWEKFVVDEFKTQHNILWQTNENKYLTCPNECDDTCWQKVLYNGNQELLKTWKHRP